MKLLANVISDTKQMRKSEKGKFLKKGCIVFLLANENFNFTTPCEKNVATNGRWSKGINFVAARVQGSRKKSLS